MMWVGVGDGASYGECNERGCGKGGCEKVGLFKLVEEIADD